jgi:hypothetical protein
MRYVREEVIGLRNPNVALKTILGGFEARRGR